MAEGPRGGAAGDCGLVGDSADSSNSGVDFFLGEVLFGCSGLAQPGFFRTGGSAGSGSFPLLDVWVGAFGCSRFAFFFLLWYVLSSCLSVSFFLFFLLSGFYVCLYYPLRRQRLMCISDRAWGWLGFVLVSFGLPSGRLAFGVGR